MTPLQLEMLIWFYTRDQKAAPFPNMHMQPQQEALTIFESVGVIDRKDFPCLTAVGHAWLALILDTPVPDTEFVDPRTKKTIAPIHNY